MRAPDTAARALREPLVGVGAAACVITLLLWPALSSTQRPEDWYQHFWYVWHQAESIRANGVPSLFAQNELGVFDPHYAFYGSTLYASVGALTILVTSAKVAFGMSAVLAVAAAYGGWYWLARMARLGPWVAHVPGVLFVTSPYYLNTIYRTGARAELVAVSSIPLLLASGISVVRAERLRPGPALALASSTIFFTGSHNITLLWGTVLLTILLLAIWLALPSARRAVTRRDLLRAAAIVLPAFLVNAWFLLPNLAYYQNTLVSSSSSVYKQLHWAVPMIEPEYLFALGRPASPPRFFVLVLPIVTMTWLVVGAVVTRHQWRTSWFRFVIILFACAAALLWLMTSTSLLSDLPGPLRMLQFGFRLEGYILLCLSGAAIGLMALTSTGSKRPSPSIWRWTGTVVVALALVQGIGQTHQHHQLDASTGDRLGSRPYNLPVQQASQYDYEDARRFRHEANEALFFSRISAERDNAATLSVARPVGQLLVTNVVVMPPLLKITGADFLGHNRLNLSVFRLTSSPNGIATITVEAAHPWPVVLGRVLSLVGVLGLLGNAGASAFARRRRRRGVPVLATAA
jgi:hypothetical protein